MLHKFLTFFLVLFGVLATQAWAVERVVGANASLDIHAGAHSAALGGAAIAVEQDLLELTSNPQQLANAENSWVAFSHVVYYEDTKYDYGAVQFPLGDMGGIGIAFSRFGADDIPKIAEGDPLPEGENYKTFSIADYVFTLAWGRRFLNDHLDLGVSFHGLYRELDQSGWGFRGDIGANYHVLEQVTVSTFLKGWTSSAVTWEEGTVEYSSPEWYLGLHVEQPIEYFYGKIGAYWQSAGILHREDRDLDWDGEARGGRFWEHPVDWLGGGRAGVEFVFDFGLSLRAGLASLSEIESWTAGAGFALSNWLRVAYAFESHPTLSAVHRVSLEVSPGLFLFPKKKSAAKPAYVAESEAKQKDDVKQVPVSEMEPVETEESDEDSAGGTYWEE
ncbi:MAG: hypothetical protein J6Z31_00530 [Fibrobacter sp.]|nr:hypothetical protein [Fibrobacter sp.]